MGKVSYSILRVNEQEYPLADDAALGPHLSAIRQAEFAEVWLERGGEVTCLLTNRERQRACLMFLTEDNEAGFHAVSYNDRDADEGISFRLNNGQMDEYDLDETVSLSDGLRALEYFFANSGMAPFIVWQDDS